MLSRAKGEIPAAFDGVASSYDRLVGFNPGYHSNLRASARRLAVRESRPRLLDLCCGTGASTEALRMVYPDASIVGLDASPGMLAVARTKPRLRRVSFVQGDATDPARAGVSGPFDGVLMAYGIRNLSERDAALEAVRALLAPGACAVFHEYSVADSRLRSILWDAVCLGIIVPGGWVTARRTSLYRYLHRSVREFDGVRAFEARLERAGFTDVWTAPMQGWQRGIVHSFVARAPS